MIKERVKFLIDSFGLELLLEMNDIEQESILVYLIDEGLIDIEEYFEDER